MHSSPPPCCACPASVPPCACHSDKPYERSLQEDTRRYADLLCGALGVVSPAEAAQQLAAACVSAAAALRGAALGADTGAGAAVPLRDAGSEQHPATWEAAVAAAADAVGLLVAARGAVTATGPVEDVLHRLGGCAACAFPGTPLAARVVLMRHVARVCMPLLAGSPATDAVACDVADGGTLASVLAANQAEALWRLGDAQAHDLPLLLAAVLGHEPGGGKHAAVAAYLSVAACTRCTLRLMRAAHDIDAASGVLSRVACGWPAPGALICALPGGGRAASADGRGVSVELLGVASDADFQDVVTAWHAVTAAAGGQDAAAAEATAAAVAAEDDSLFFFDVAGDAAAEAGEPDGDGEHGGDLDAWMGDTPGGGEDDDRAEDEP